MHGMAIPQSVGARSVVPAWAPTISGHSAIDARDSGIQRAGANANAVKELVLAALLLAARNVIPALGYVGSLERDAPDLEHRIEAGKKQFAGVELPGGRSESSASVRSAVSSPMPRSSSDERHRLRSGDHRSKPRGACRRPSARRTASRSC